MRWKLYPAQREVYDAICAFLDNPETRYEQFYLDISRQFGKTFLGVLVASERAIRNPGWRVLYTASARTGLWQFVQPNIDTLLSDCPHELRPEWSTTDNSYHFPNGSQVHLVGANGGHEDDARGPRADLVINEEAAFVDRLAYLVRSVELPMLTTTGGRILHITTRPETPAHEVTGFRIDCQLAGNYVRRTIDDATHLSEAARKKIERLAGGRESSTFRREYLCEDVVDEVRAAVPEFEAHSSVIVREPAVPAYFYPLEGMDVGFGDFHAVLYMLWDFRRAKLLVVDESFLRQARTDQIADAVKAKEAELWPWAPRETERNDAGRYVFEPWRALRRPIYRYSDTDLRLIADLSVIHNLAFAPTAKDHKEAQVNELRMFVKDERIEIHPRCVNLIRHLRTTLWNRQRTEWERTVDGHGDGVDALLYGLRNAPRHMNPFPGRYDDLDPRTSIIPPFGDESPTTPASRAVAAIYGKHHAN